MNAFALSEGLFPASHTPEVSPQRVRVTTNADVAVPAGRVQAITRRSDLLVTARSRLLLLMGCFALVAAIAVLRIGYLGIRRFRAQSDQPCRSAAAPAR